MNSTVLLVCHGIPLEDKGGVGLYVQSLANELANLQWAPQWCERVERQTLPNVARRHLVCYTAW